MVKIAQLVKCLPHNCEELRSLKPTYTWASSPVPDLGTPLTRSDNQDGEFLKLMGGPASLDNIAMNHIENQSQARWSQH